MRPLKKIKMNRIFKALCLVSIIAFSASCKKDDDVSIAPPRDYGVQYATEKAQIEDYMKTHYIHSVDDNYNVVIKKIEGTGHVSLWDDPRKKIKETLNNNVLYEINYILLNQGTGAQSSLYDEVDVAYSGWSLIEDNDADNFTDPFDTDPFGGSYYPVINYIAAWGEILPLFNAGVYNDGGNPQDPASFTDFGAGIMFVPSGLAYFNAAAGSLPSYTPSAFSFKLFRTKVLDTDNDGLPNQYETVPGTNLNSYDTDGDGVPNYQDIDDDNDGYPTRDEISNPDGSIMSYDQIPNCAPIGNAPPVKRHIDPSCNQNF